MDRWSRFGFRQVVVLLVLIGTVACGGDVERTTGVIRGQVAWSGSWPDEGAVLLALFKTAPWAAGYQPGPPVAFEVFPANAASPMSFALDNPPLAFDTYQTLVVAWQDPAEGEMASRMFPLSVYGTSLDELDAATVIHLDKKQPDVEVALPDCVLFATPEQMREHYQALQ